MSGGFTPGPWVADKKKQNLASIRVMQQLSGASIAAVQGRGPVAEANAALVAAAPDLYAVALSTKSLLASCGHHLTRAGFSVGPLLDAIDEALAKAKGEH